MTDEIGLIILQQNVMTQQALRMVLMLVKPHPITPVVDELLDKLEKNCERIREFVDQRRKM